MHCSNCNCVKDLLLFLLIATNSSVSAHSFSSFVGHPIATWDVALRPAENLALSLKRLHVSGELFI